MRLVIFVEEESAKAALLHIVRKLGIDETHVMIIAFQGVSNMLRSLPMRLRGWRDPDAKFLIIRDNDRGKCISRKKQIEDICSSAGSGDRVKIRIISEELEAWFLGDLDAVAAAGYGKIITSSNRKRWRSPETVVKPSQELNRALGFYAKVQGADKIAREMSISGNLCSSFGHTVEAICDLLEIPCPISF